MTPAAGKPTATKETMTTISNENHQIHLQPATEPEQFPIGQQLEEFPANQLGIL